MASIDEKTPAPPPQLHLKTPNVTEKTSHETLDSDALTPTTEKKSAAVTMESPRTSNVSSPQSNRLNPFDTDIEAMITPTTTAGGTSRKLTTTCTKQTGTGPDCQVWPGRDHWKKKAKADKRARTCNCLAKLSRRNRIIVRCVIVVAIVLIAVGVGIGISRPLGAGMWSPPDH